MSIKFVDFTGTPFVPYLLAVIPRGVKLSEQSRLDPEKLGKTPGLYNIREDTWASYAWQKDIMREEQLRAVDRWYANQPASIIAIQAADLCGLDVDFDEARIAAIAYEIAVKVFSWAPKRIRAGSHKFLMCYRRKSDEPFIRKQRLAIEHEVFGLGLGKHACEFLGFGQHYLLSGQHMDGSFYEWDKQIFGGAGDPISWGWDNIPEVTHAQVAQFFAELEEALKAEQWVRKKFSGSASGGGGERHPIGPDHPELAPNLEILGRALAAVPVDSDDLLDYDQWFRFLAALKAACGGDEVFYEEHIVPWTLTQWPDSDLTRMKWESVRESALGWGFVSNMAHTFGFTEHLEALFEALPPIMVETTAADGTTTTAPAPTGPLIPFYAYNEITSRWIAQNHDHYCFVPQNGGGGGDWRECVDGIWEITHTAATDIRTFCQDTGRDMQRSGNLSNQQVERANALLDAGNSAVTVERQIKTDRRFVKRPVEFDTHPYLVGVPGGFVNERGIVRPPDPGLLITRRALCRPDYHMKAPRFLHLINNLANGDPDVEHTLQMMLAYTMCGLPNQKLFPFLLGLSNTGKSQLMIILSEIMGGQAGGYARRAATETFMQLKSSAFNKRSFDLSDLDGSWFVYVSEIAKGQTFNEPLIKDVTGGDNVYAEAKFKAGRDLKVRFVPWFAANHFPRVVTPDPALRNRMVIFNCQTVVPDKDVDKHFARHVVDDEGPGIMALLLTWRNEMVDDGCIIIPESMLRERDARFAKSDKIRLFLEEAGVFEPGRSTRTHEVYDHYKKWCQDNRYEAEGRNTFYENLKEHEVFRANNCAMRKTRLIPGRANTSQHVVEGWRIYSIDDVEAYTSAAHEFENVELGDNDEPAFH